MQKKKKEMEEQRNKQKGDREINSKMADINLT